MECVLCTRSPGHVFFESFCHTFETRVKALSNSTKQHSWQFVSSGNVANYRGFCFFPPDLAKKICHMSSDDFCNHALKLIDCCPHVLVKITLLCGKTNGNETCVDKNNKQLRMHTTHIKRPCETPGKPPRRSQHVGARCHWFKTMRPMSMDDWDEPPLVSMCNPQ